MRNSIKLFPEYFSHQLGEREREAKNEKYVGRFELSAFQACALDGDIGTELIDRILLWLPTSLSLSLVKTLSLAWFHRRKAVERTRAEEREERLHLHLNLAVDLAVVRGHRSCRGKGGL